MKKIIKNFIWYPINNFKNTKKNIKKLLSKVFRKIKVELNHSLTALRENIKHLKRGLLKQTRVKL